MTDWRDRIDVNPAVLVGKPIVKGTRISVELVIEHLSNGWTIDQTLEQHPRLERDDVFACLRYAGERVKSEVVVPRPR